MENNTMNLIKLEHYGLPFIDNAFANCVISTEYHHYVALRELRFGETMDEANAPLAR